MLLCCSLSCSSWLGFLQYSHKWLCSFPSALHRVGLCGDTGYHMPWGAASRAQVPLDVHKAMGGVFTPALAAVTDLLSSKLPFLCLVPVASPSPQRSLLPLDWRSSLSKLRGLNHAAGWVLVSPEKSMSREGKVLSVCEQRE